ncbi:unnamed protein product [Trifolium pratense]|uniref:Uncharacterized protein n=1 Tax=Trifolium pratense TaxID=57577 RepID=A0ACB0K7Q9_TRIPR|nr:unnamed protein product [Trifolium pratense]
MDNNISKSVKYKVVINELIKGQEAATKLKFLLQNQKNYPFGGGSLSSYKLAANVLRSFTEALSIISQPAGCDDLLNLLHSGENGLPVVIKKSSLPAKGGRGCYKRRKNEETWSIVSSTIDDNHSWRKYGQKEIMNSEFPRSYLRCKFKKDQGCLATKQVQKTQDNPDMYEITYIGIHTCNTTLNNDVVLVNSDPDEVKVLTQSLSIKQRISQTRTE